MNIVKKLIPINFDVGRNGKKPEFIMIHTNGGPAPSGLFGWFSNPAAKVSAHYQINFAGNIEQYVEESNTAWHGGSVDINNRSIGIEHEDKGNSKDSIRSNELYEASAQLCADIYKRYGWDIENQAYIKPHHEFVPSRPCPDGLNLGRIRQRTYDILHVKPPTPAPDPKDQKILDLTKQLQNSSESLQNALKQVELDKVAVSTLKEATGTLQGRIDGLQASLDSANKSNIDLKTVNKGLQEENASYEEFKKSLLYSIFLVFKGKIK